MLDIIRNRARDTDNYNYLLQVENELLWVDPLYPLKFLKKIEREELHLKGILITHTHWDHIDGVAQVRENHDVPVFVHRDGVGDLADPNCKIVSEGDTIPFGDEMLTVYEVPGHHPAHLLFHGAGVAVLGDLLFEAGCGSPLFGGTVEKIFASLQRLPAILRDDDRLLWGHNYDTNNLQFAHHYWPQDDAIAARLAEREALDEFTLPPIQTWGNERKVNPFLRLDDSALLDTLRKVEPKLAEDPKQVFYCLRGLRNVWRGVP